MLGSVLIELFGSQYNRPVRHSACPLHQATQPALPHPIQRNEDMETPWNGSQSEHSHRKDDESGVQLSVQARFAVRFPVLLLQVLPCGEPITQLPLCKTNTDMRLKTELLATVVCAACLTWLKKENERSRNNTKDYCHERGNPEPGAQVQRYSKANIRRIHAKWKPYDYAFRIQVRAPK